MLSRKFEMWKGREDGNLDFLMLFPCTWNSALIKCSQKKFSDGRKKNKKKDNRNQKKDSSKVFYALHLVFHKLRERGSPCDKRQVFNIWDRLGTPGREMGIRKSISMSTFSQTEGGTFTRPDALPQEARVIDKEAAGLTSNQANRSRCHFWSNKDKSAMLLVHVVVRVFDIRWIRTELVGVRTDRISKILNCLAFERSNFPNGYTYYPFTCCCNWVA